jgi:copper transport protein
VLESAPAKVELFFKDPVQIYRSSVIVTNDQKEEVQDGKPWLDPKDDRHLYVNFEKRPSNGYILLVWIWFSSVHLIMADKCT